LDAHFRPEAEPPPDSRRDLALGLVALAMGLAPALAVIAAVPEFTTQDGPAHLYSARIINASLRPGSPFAGTFSIAWQPLPNWAGHWATMAAVATLPPLVANRAVAALTLVTLAAAVVWLRRAVAGDRGLWVAALLAALLALNVTWLLGFTSFLLGAALMPVTLGVWWGGREWFGPGRALAVAALLVLGYACHPIGLGMTVGGLLILAAWTPCLDRGRRAAWTAASLIPMVPLGLVYRSLTRSGGGLEPAWQYLGRPWSARAWVAQLGWVDPISLAGKAYQPFGAEWWVGNGLASPAIWTVAAVGLLVVVTRRRGGNRRGWAILAGLLLAGGLVGPDTLGERHGHYLPQRVALLGLVALVPWLDLAADRRARKLAGAMLALALAVQSAFVWDYARDCRDRVGALLEARPAIAPGTRVGTLLVGIKGRFRSNPLLHADCLLGAADDDVVWSNYETSHYYFPVKVRPGLGQPPAIAFEKVALLDGPGEDEARARLWQGLLDDHAGTIDVVLEWGSDPRLDAITAARYVASARVGPARVWSRAGPP